MSYKHTALICASPLCPKADARSLTVTPRSCVIYFSSLCHMHKHSLQTLCVKQRRETDDTWWEHYSASNIDGQHFIGVRDSKVKRQKNDWGAPWFPAQSWERTLCWKEFQMFSICLCCLLAWNNALNTNLGRYFSQHDVLRRNVKTVSAFTLISNLHLYWRVPYSCEPSRLR